MADHAAISHVFAKPLQTAMLQLRDPVSLGSFCPKYVWSFCSLVLCSENVLLDFGLFFFTSPELGWTCVAMFVMSQSFWKEHQKRWAFPYFSLLSEVSLKIKSHLAHKLGLRSWEHICLAGVVLVYLYLFVMFQAEVDVMCWWNCEIPGRKHRWFSFCRPFDLILNPPNIRIVQVFFVNSRS